jgi:hypothetical protein
MDGALVYRKSGRGAAALAAAHDGDLSARERQVLILLDGSRTVSELSELFDGETLRRVIPELEAKGLAKRVDPRLAAELGGAITQFRTGPHGGASAAAAGEPRPDGHPLAWSVLMLALTICSGYWLANRYQTQAETIWEFHIMAPVDWSGVSAATVTSNLVDQSRPDHVGPVTVAPITRLPASRLERR